VIVYKQLFVVIELFFYALYRAKSFPELFLENYS